MKNKRGQEEIVGFLLIVVIVIVIGVIFLFMFKPKISEKKDFQTENLLYSIIGTTMNGKTVGEGIKNCENGEGCDILKKNLDNLTDIVFNKMGYSLGRNMRGYNFTISGGMEYSNFRGNKSINSIAAASVVRNSLVKLKFYY